MNIVGLNGYTTATGGPPRKKRRPALACNQCRSRKIKCDRNSPCQPCLKANINDCQYVYENRTPMTEAPFDAQETHFSVFQQTPTTLLQVATTAATTVLPQETPYSTADDPGSYENLYEHGSLQAGSEQSAVFGDRSPNFGHYAALNHSAGPPGADHWPPPLQALYPNLKVSERGIFYKGRFHGRSHWMNFIHKVSQSPSEQCHSRYFHVSYTG
jgi:hypothetical protein